MKSFISPPFLFLWHLLCAQVYWRVESIFSIFGSFGILKIEDYKPFVVNVVPTIYLSEKCPPF